MQLIQEFVRDNDFDHMEEKSYGFRIIKHPKYDEFGLDYDFNKEYDNMLIKELPKGFKETR